MRNLTLIFCLPLLLAGCSKEEEHVQDLDKMVFLEEEEEIWDESPECLTQEGLYPHEFLIIEQPEHEIAEEDLTDPLPRR